MTPFRRPEPLSVLSGAKDLIPYDDIEGYSLFFSRQFKAFGFDSGAFQFVLHKVFFVIINYAFCHKLKLGGF